MKGPKLSLVDVMTWYGLLSKNVYSFARWHFIPNASRCL